MKYCSGCGVQLDDNAIFCYNCGRRTNGDSPVNSYAGGMNSRAGKIIIKILVAALGFNLPFAGLVLWCLWRTDENNRGLAKIAGIAAIVGAIFGVIGVALELLLAFLGGTVTPDVYMALPHGFVSTLFCLGGF